LVDDPEYMGRKWNGFAALTEQAYARFGYKNFSVVFGRDFLKWGTGKTGNLLLSDNSQPFDQFSFSVKFKFFKFSYIGARLDNWPLADSLAQQYRSLFMNRYLSAHRLDINFKNKLYVGFTEALLYGGPNGGVELQYRSEEVLGKRGFLIGCEYVRITNRTYNSAFEWEKFLHRNKPIGYYLGNDFDKWSFYLNKWLSKDFFIKGGLDYIRRGEGTVKSDWDILIILKEKKKQGGSLSFMPG
jgi:hypothetical protein